jgi:integrase
MSARSRRGTGNVFQKGSAWYGRFYARGERVKRSLGPMRQPGSRDGLTKVQAEARLRELMANAASAPAPVVERLTVDEAGERLVKQLRLKGRKPSTIDGYESYLRVHLVPYFGDKSLNAIDVEDVEDFLEASLTRGLSGKTAMNLLGFLHGIFEFAVRKRWAHSNPCKEVEAPERPDRDQEIHFLEQAELDALIRATGAPRSRHTPATLERAARVRVLRDVEQLGWNEIAAKLGCAPSTAVYLYGCDPELVLEDDLARVERVLYLTAAMTGIRQGELIALRWLDIDRLSHRVRVRRSYVRGQYGSPKSKRSSRSVPLADRVAAELEALYQASVYQADEDLVFGHPHSGRPLDRSLLLKRFKRNLERAGVRPVRFHDLRHTFGTRMAAAGVPMRALQEWMGHRDYKTTLIYADYAPAGNETDLVNAAFRTEGPKEGPKLSETQVHSNRENPMNPGVEA